ncbi:hypothetical protein [Trichormus variabilis]|uniref:hypothetical protein n=1 Tax=Anabaena variabilis TaxID=264691 RepID=UPI0013152E42|nr:hypothetical protein [Trichormus variabilis]MBD2627203.1 hypothetical protein [Trichormus variabilis FACHB-164]
MKYAAAKFGNADFIMLALRDRHKSFVLVSSVDDGYSLLLLLAIAPGNLNRQNL